MEPREDRPSTVRCPLHPWTLAVLDSEWRPPESLSPQLRRYKCSGGQRKVVNKILEFQYHDVFRVVYQRRESVPERLLG